MELITLQYRIGFAIHQHESAKGVHMLPILNPPSSSYHPFGSSQCTSPKHPVFCIEPGLAIRFLYDIIHVSMLFSQIIPPSPSPTESKRLFYTSVSLLLSRIQGYHYHLSKFHIYMYPNPERWCCESAALNMPANLENSAVATGLEKLSFHSNPKERQCQRKLKLPHNCTHLTC